MVQKIDISALAALLVISFSAFAKAETDMVANGLNADLAPIENNTSDDAEFYHEDEGLGKVKLPEKPECSSPELYAKVMQKVTEYLNSINAQSTLAKRNKALISANLDGFHQVSVKNFTPEQDLKTANALVMIKINDKIAENDIMICRQNRDIPRPVYLIVYPYADNYRVYIINLDKNSSDYRDITLIFP